MKALSIPMFLFSLLIFSQAATVLAQANRADIIGGDEVAPDDPVAMSTVLILGHEADPELGQDRDFICTGSILSGNVVITAAHCLGRDGQARLQIAFRTRVDGPGEVMEAAHQIRPADYERKALLGQPDQNDIALIKLPRPLPPGYRPAQTLASSRSLEAGSSLLLAGYGIDRPLIPANGKAAGAGILRAVAQTVIDPHFGKTEVLINIRGQGSCHGDSGGPAFLQNGSELLLFGVASRLTDHDQIGEQGIPQDYSCSVDMVYTNLLAKMPWILSTIRKL